MEKQNEIIDRVVKDLFYPDAQSIIDNCDLSEYWRGRYIMERDENLFILRELKKNFEEIRPEIMELIKENEALSNVYEELELNLKEQTQ